MEHARSSVIAWHACLYLGCIAAEGPPPGETIVLLSDDEGRVLSPSSASYLVMDADTSSAAVWLAYSERHDELPWPALTVKATDGRVVPLPDRMSPFGTGKEVSSLELADRRLKMQPSPCELREVALAPSDPAVATRWASDTVLHPQANALEVRGLSGIVLSTTLAVQLYAAESVGAELAIGLGSRAGELFVIDTNVLKGERPREVQFEPPLPPATEVGQLAVNGGNSREFTYYFTGSDVYRISSSGQGTGVAFDTTATEVFGAGDHVMALSGLEARYLDAPNSVFAVAPLDAPYISGLRAAAYLPTRRGETLFAVAFGPVGVVLLRYGDGSWRPYVVLNDVAQDYVALSASDSRIVFGHSAGWGVYDTLHGLRCLGSSQLRNVHNIIALSNGTYYVQGSDAATGENASAWLVPN